jgi:Tfp pilus assembly protein PilO
VTFDLLKRPPVYGTIAGVVVLLLVWWFAWMSPEGNKLASVNTQQSSLQSQIASLNSQIAILKAQSALVPGELPYLAKFNGAVPNLPESGVLTEELFGLMNSTKTFISSLNDSTVTSSGTGFSTIPVQISVTGSEDQVVNFMKGLYTLPRLVTIQSVTLAPPTQSDILKPSKAQGFTAAITATAYTTFVPPTPPPAPATTTAP